MIHHSYVLWLTQADLFLVDGFSCGWVLFEVSVFLGLEDGFTLDPALGCTEVTFIIAIDIDT